MKRVAMGLPVGSLRLLASYMAGAGLWGYKVFVFIILFCVGILFPASTTVAMTEGN